MSLNYKQNDELIPLYQSGVSPNQMDNTETDANDCVPIDTDIKVYRVGNNATNIPIQQAGIIETFVYRDSGNVRVTQRYTVNYNTSGTPTFSRTAIGDDNSLTWSEWSTFDNYSTDEQVVGKWIDGKPIYRKVIAVNKAIAIRNEWIAIYTNDWIRLIERLISVKGTYNESGYTINGYAYFRKSNNIIETYTSDGTRFEYLILEYTKTTDA